MNAFLYVTVIGAFIFFGFLGMLIWCVRNGQLDDLSTPADRALWEDDIDT